MRDAWARAFRRPGGDTRLARRATLIGLATLIAAGSLIALGRAFGPRGRWFAFFVVWLPMTWLGTISRLVTPRLPECYFRLRRFERDGRVYRLVGVRVAKAVLRRRPFSWFNPDLHLPHERTTAQLTHLDQRMRDAEASHAILFVVTLGIVAHALLRGWRRAAVWTLLFDVLLNGYPVMLQRDNRARLARRFTGLI